MTIRTATCRCGQLQVVCTGDPVRISVCHCLNCKKRSGSAFAAQARWMHEDVALSGNFREWSEVGDSGKRATFRFCPICGSTVTYVAEGLPDFTAVAVGAFAEPDFPPPDYSVYEERMHKWVAIVGDGIEHYR
ncbi:MAG: GFA family protein [Sphingobium sp.]|nr:GFA family protein [Sphingobium sp.]